MKALIDADIPIYQHASNCEETVPWPYNDEGERIWMRTANEDEAWAHLMSSFSTLQEAVKADEGVFAVTDFRRNWRFDHYASYKSNRSDKPKPILVPILRDRVASLDQGYRRPGLEGDDILGILATMKSAGDTIIVTIDKDLRTIPGRHYNFGQKEFFEVTEGEANQYHLWQTLAGDTTDGYPGCKGIGMIKAKKLIPDGVEPGDVLEVWKEIVLPAFDKAGFDEEFALSQARVARILRASDYDFKDKKVIPWSPY